MRAWVLCRASSLASRLARSAVRSAITLSSDLRLPSSARAAVSTEANAALACFSRRRSIIAVNRWARSRMAAAFALCSAAVLALTKRAAAAEISPDMADRRNASVISGTSRFATPPTPRSAAENDVTATAVAITVMTDTAANASCSLILMPRPPIHWSGLKEDGRSIRLLLVVAIGASVRRDLDQLVDGLERTVGLNHGHEHLIEALVVVRTERH